MDLECEDERPGTLLGPVFRNDESETLYETVWCGSTPDRHGGFTKGELTGPRDTFTAEPNPVVINITSTADWEALKDADPSLRYIAAFGPRRMHFGAGIGNPWTGNNRYFRGGPRGTGQKQAIQRAKGTRK